jgi:peroxiredoxin
MRVRRRSATLGRLALGLLAVATAAPASHAAPAAPAFYVTLLGTGQRFDSRSALGKTVLMVRFQASWCKVCAEEAPAMERLYRTYRDRGVAVIALHIQDTEADARAFLEAHRASYPAGLDPRLAVANRYGLRGTPYTVVVDRRGEIVARLHGRTDEARLGRVLDSLLAPGPRPAPPRPR